MVTLFFYGTLRDISLLEIVTGLGADVLKATPAKLAGYSVAWVQDAMYPMIYPDPEGMADGVIAGIPDAVTMERLEYYEGGFDYQLKPVVVQVDGQERPAKMFYPQGTNLEPGVPWSLQGWQESWAEISRRAAKEAMEYFGQITPDHLQRLLPNMRVRAASSILAENTPAPKGYGREDVVVHETRRPYINFFALEELDLQFRRFDNSLSAIIERATFLAADVAIVLPYDPVRDRVLLVEQFRLGPFRRGDPAPWCLEAVAGRIDPGETPEEAAIREVREEAGLELKKLEKVSQCYPSPGTSTEFFHIFVGLTDLPDSSAGIGGLESEHEDIRSHLLDFDAIMNLVEGEAALVAPTVLAALWLARHRDRLRSAA